MPNKKADPNSLAAIATRLRLLRMALAYDEAEGRPGTQSEFARMFGCHVQTWNGYEMGYARIGVDTAMSLASRYGVSLDWIYRGDDGLMPQRIMRRIAELERLDSPYSNGAPRPRKNA